jgi:hypothetical protein
VLLILAIIFNLPLTLTSRNVNIIPAVLLDTENVGVTFEVSLLSGIEAEILLLFISTSGIGDHL